MNELDGYLRLPERGRARPKPRPARLRPAFGPGCLVVVAVTSEPGGWVTRHIVGRLEVRSLPAPVLFMQGRAIPLGLVPSLPGEERSPASPLPAAAPEDTQQPAANRRDQPQAARQEAAPSPGEGLELRAVRSLSSFRMASPLEHNLVTPALAEALEAVFESFARQAGGTSEKPLPIFLACGYAPGDPSHSRGQAADISAVGGRSLAQWKADLDSAVQASRSLEDPDLRKAAIAEAAGRNLGYQLYRTLLQRGGWRTFNGVVQLFGPWTEVLGPWKRLPSGRDHAPRRARANQEQLLRAHHDHIHVALG